MLAKFCSRSHGQPLPGVRSGAMMSSKPLISREGSMAHRLDVDPTCMPQERPASQQNEPNSWRFPPIGAVPEGCYGTAMSESIEPIFRNATALVLFSGGQDSATCLAWALARFARVETLGFRYGQRHAIELDCRTGLLDGMRLLRADWAAKLGDNHTLEIPTLAEISDTALTRNVAIEMGADGLPNTFVPGRNLVFLTFAAAR